jgi:hypothetical protein
MPPQWHQLLQKRVASGELFNLALRGATYRHDKAANPGDTPEPAGVSISTP